MIHPIIKTDNYILIVENSEKPIIGKWYYNSDTKNLFVIVNDYPIPKSDIVIAHLPLNNSSILEGVPLLPPLPNEDIDLASQEYPFLFIEGYNKAKEKYKFTEEDVIKIVEKSRETGLTAQFLMLSLSQPKLPVGFKCRIEYLTSSPKIINGVMQGEWIFE